MNEHFDKHFQDRALLRELIQNWVVWRDAAQWDDFRKVWHHDGRMIASWKQAPFEEFISASQKGMERGVNIQHMLGGSAIKVAGTRAISQTRVAITQRASLDNVLCDVNCLARHYDFWESREEQSGVARWGLVLRDTIFDKATFQTVDQNARLVIDDQLLKQFPAEYAALAYLQEKIGYTVSRNMPHGWRGSAVEALYRRGEAWLADQTAKPWDEV